MDRDQQQPLEPHDDPRLTAYVLGELSEADAALLEAELAADESLREVVEQLQRTAVMLVEALNVDEGLLLSDEQRAAIEERFAHSAHEHLHHDHPVVLRGPLFWWTSGAIAAAAALLIALPMFLQPSAPSRGPEGSGLTVVRGLPPLEISDLHLDLGEMSPHGAASGSVMLTNTGDEPLTITASNTSCTCADVTPAATVIRPGESIPLMATLHAYASPGRQSSDVELRIKGYDNPVTFHVRSEVAMDVRAVPSEIVLDGFDSDDLNGTITIESADGKPFNILAAGGKAPRFVGHDPALDDPCDRYTLQWDLEDAVRECALMPWWWVIETDHPDCPVLPVRIRHHCTDPNGTLQFNDLMANAGQIVAGESAEVVVDIAGLGCERLYEVASWSADIRAEIVDSETDGEITRVRVRITPRSNLRGLLYAPIVFRTANGDAQLPVIGRVVEARTDAQAKPVMSPTLAVAGF